MSTPEGVLGTLVEGAAARHHVPGLALVAVVGDTVVGTAAAGRASLTSGTPMTPHHACNWFSMTKIATATATMMLVERGTLDLDAPVGGYLGDAWPPRFAAVRVRHLLSHSSGLANPVPLRWVHRAGEPRPDPRALLARLVARQRKLRFEPGTKAEYTNVGYLALGEVVAGAAARPYEDFVRDELLRPLGMRHTGFTWAATDGAPPATGYQRLSRALTPLLRAVLPGDLVAARTGAFVALEPFELDGAAYGGLVGPALDAARLLTLHVNEGVVDGTRLLGADTVHKMTTITVDGKRFDLGLGWFRPADMPGPAVEHLGGGIGFFNVLRLDPGRGAGVALMSNTTRRWPVEELVDSVLAQVVRPT
jgi:CubicO group peptidase (beta-lactamase class C family)